MICTVVSGTMVPSTSPSRPAMFTAEDNPLSHTEQKIFVVLCAVSLNYVCILRVITKFCFWSWESVVVLFTLKYYQGIIWVLMFRIETLVILEKITCTYLSLITEALKPLRDIDCWVDPHFKFENLTKSCPSSNSLLLPQEFLNKIHFCHTVTQPFKISFYCSAPWSIFWKEHFHFTLGLVHLKHF